MLKVNSSRESILLLPESDTVAAIPYVSSSCVIEREGGFVFTVPSLRGAGTTYVNYWKILTIQLK
jgi:hypothetical protein